MKESRKTSWDALRADPHEPRPGTSKAISLQTGTKKTITVDLPVLKLLVIDASGAPYADKAYTLQVEGSSSDKKTGTTQAGTPLTQKMMGKGTVQLSLELPGPSTAAPASSPPGAPPAPTAAGAVPAYPLPIQAGDFMDAVAKPEDVTVRWQLTAIASDLFDQDKTQAALVRLQNLGFHLPKPDPSAPETQASVRAFQRKYGLPTTGALEDVQQRLMDEHDKP